LYYLCTAGVLHMTFLWGMVVLLGPHDSEAIDCSLQSHLENRKECA